MKIKDIKKSHKKEIKGARHHYRTEKKKHKKLYKDKISDLKERYIEDYADAVAARGKRIPVNPPKRALLEEIGNAVSHGLGAAFATVALVLMIVFSEKAVEVVSACVYSFGLLAMFLMSCLYHAFSHGSRVKRLFRRFDYSGIYLLIGATFAPVLLSYIGGVFGLVFFIIQWTIIAAGITFVAVFGPERLKFLHTPLYLLLGWCAIMLLPRMFENDPALAWYILAGGIIYSLGIIPFAMKNKVAHFIWHFFVLAGAAVQWIGIFIYIYLK